MNTDINQTKHCNKESPDVAIDLEFEHYLFEVYLNERIENEIQRMMELACSPDENQPNPNNHEL
jgi:hypothetical protein